MYVWGGQRDCNSERYFNDMHCFDFRTHYWHEVKQQGTIPEARYAATALLPVTHTHTHARARARTHARIHAHSHTGTHTHTHTHTLCLSPSLSYRQAHIYPKRIP
jgi:hypothetical protein